MVKQSLCCHAVYEWMIPTATRPVDVQIANTSANPKPIRAGRSSESSHWFGKLKIGKIELY